MSIGEKVTNFILTDSWMKNFELLSFASADELARAAASARLHCTLAAFCI